MLLKAGILLIRENLLGETYGELLKRMEATIRFRREELTKGKIEVGEAVSKPKPWKYFNWIRRHIYFRNRNGK